MRWALASVLIPMLFGIGFADEVGETGRTLTPEQAQEWIEFENHSLSFDNVTSLTPEVAAILAKHKGEYLSLSDLKSLTPDAAAALSAYKGELVLDRLETLSFETAKALARHDGRLNLNGVSSISDDAALALAKHQGDLCMQSLRELFSDPLARQLLLAGNTYRVGGDGGLNPDRLTSISPEVAELLVIAEQDGDSLSLTELKSPSIDVLKVLARINGDLNLGIKSVSPEMARVLAAQPGNLALPAAKEIDRATLATLATKEGGLELYLTAITPEVAMILSGFNGSLTLHVERLPEDVERELAKTKASLEMPELKELKTGDLARKLVESQSSKEEWSLALEAMSPAVAGEFQIFRGRLLLPKLETISSDAADRLSNCRGELVLRGLRELTSPSLARKLAACPRSLTYELYTFGNYSGLHLPNLKNISPEIARDLASLSGNVLLLDGLDTLSDESADALASFEGILSLGKLSALTPRSQAALGSGKARCVRLSSLLELSDPVLAKKVVDVQRLEVINADVAAVLAGRSNFLGEWCRSDSQGNLSLSLKEITPVVAASLAQKTGHWTNGSKLSLPALQTLDAVSASALAKCRVPLCLSGLKQLTPETAAAFNGNTEYIVLDGVEEISVEVAKVLAMKKEGRLSFRPEFDRKRNTPLRLPEQSADLLRNQEHIILPRDTQP